MPAYMKLGDIKGETTSQYRKMTLDNSVLPYPGAAALVASVRKAHPGGANQILIGLLPVPGYKITTNSQGIIAILIGLLLPAVQKLAAGPSSELKLMSGALAANGRIGFAMHDGSILPAPGGSSGFVAPGDVAGFTAPGDVAGMR